MCVTCGDKHNSRASVKAHCRVDHGMFTCHISFCQAMFVSEGACKKHEHVHDSKSRTCKDCGQVFLHQFALQRHSVIHKSKPEFSCCRCNSSYKRKQDLTEHFRTQHKSVTFSCSQCSFMRGSLRQVRQHEYGHKPLSLQCERCGEKFTYPSRLSNHRKQCVA